MSSSPLANCAPLQRHDNPVDDILTKNRTGFREAVTARVQALVEEEHLGVTLEIPIGLDVYPPLSLVDKFNAVDTATVKRDGNGGAPAAPIGAQE